MAEAPAIIEQQQEAHLAASAIARIPDALPDDLYKRANMVAQAVLGHHDSHMAWPLWRHAGWHMGRKAAHASIVEGIRRSRLAILALGLAEANVVTGIACSGLMADAMLKAVSES